MTDDRIDPPRVDRLVYRALAEGDIFYIKTERDPSSSMGLKYVGSPEDMVGGTSDFTVTISEGSSPRHCVATVEMISDFTTISEALEVVEPYLKAWEIQSLINHLDAHDDFSQPLRFEYLSSEMSNPTPLSATAHLSAAHAFMKGDFPTPPHTFSASSDVRLMWRRWGQYRAGHETLPGMAYYCLTIVESTIGRSGQSTRHAAANRYSISIDVLNKLGDLTSEVGDENERRKEHAMYRRPYTPVERTWIEHVVLALIGRLGYAAWRTTTDDSNDFSPITLADFPTI